jgi:hypothetical protein
MSSAWGRIVEMRDETGDLEPGVRIGLQRLGYRLISADEGTRLQPAGRVINPRALADVPNDPTPIILIGAATEAAREDARVAGVLQRPADLTRLYRLLQDALEEQPRECPRATTILSARCVEGERDWPAAIVELSAKGCLLRSPESPGSGRAQVTFAVPERALVEVTAETRSHRGDYTGLYFREISERHRSAVADYVNHLLVN